jgi:hypothetical protein
MAERRMFAKSIIGSARFLRMPPTSRLLYYDLGMAADDDGIVEAFTVLRTTGAAEDDLRVLAARGFVTILNGDLVSYIRDWGTNNQIRKDRYHPSMYAELLVKIESGEEVATDGLPVGNQMETEVRLGKDRLGKPTEETTVSSCAEPESGSTPPVIGLPLNDGTEYGITEEQCREWSVLYPSVDVLQQLRNMRGWLLSNKEKRKTKRGIGRFITGWLSREQDRGHSGRVEGERREIHGAALDSGINQGQATKKWSVSVTEL